MLSLDGDTQNVGVSNTHAEEYKTYMIQGICSSSNEAFEKKLA